MRVFWADGAAREGRDAQRREEGARNLVHRRTFRYAAKAEYGVSPINRKNIREDAAILAKILKDGVRKIRHGGAIGAHAGELHEVLRILYRQCPEQHDIHQAKEGRIGADAESERKHRDSAEARRPRQRADCITQILQNHSHRSTTMRST